MDLPLLQSVNSDKVARIIESIKKNINCPLSSGTGRLFDAVAAISGICIHSRYHAEAPMRLESAIIQGIQEHYDFELNDVISFDPAIRQICKDVNAGIPAGVISARFHNTIAAASVQAVERISRITGIQQVVLSGGSFQNKYLLETLESGLIKNNLTVYTHSKVPCNDGGIALGQLAVAAHKNASTPLSVTSP